MSIQPLAAPGTEPDEHDLSPTSPVVSPAEDSDVNTSPHIVDGPEPKPGLDGTPVRCMCPVRFPERVC